MHVYILCVPVIWGLEVLRRVEQQPVLSVTPQTLGWMTANEGGRRGEVGGRVKKGGEDGKGRGAWIKTGGIAQQ